MRKARNIAIWCLVALLIGNCGSQIASVIGKHQEWKRETAPFRALGGIVVATGGGDMGILAGREGVRTIRLRENVGDLELAGLAKRMKRFPNLATLGLEGTKVPDAGLAHLKELRQLRILILYNTRVTEEAKSDLHRELPLLRIDLIGKRQSTSMD